MEVPNDRIRTCSVVQIFSEQIPFDYAKEQVAHLLAQEIKAKLLEFNKIRVLEKMSGGMVKIGCRVDVIVPK